MLQWRNWNVTEIVYVRNPDLTKKALSKQSQSYVIGGNGNNIVLNQYK